MKPEDWDKIETPETAVTIEKEPVSVPTAEPVAETIPASVPAAPAP